MQVACIREKCRAGMEDDLRQKALWDAVVQGLPLPHTECSPGYLHMLVRAAIWNEQDATVAALLNWPAFNDDGAFVNRQTPPHKWTLLSFAAFHGRCSAAALLLRAKARVDQEGRYFREPLFEAACHEDTCTAQLLLAANGLGTRRTSIIDDLLLRNVYAYRVLYCRRIATIRLS
jgi:hypothetical protein